MLAEALLAKEEGCAAARERARGKVAALRAEMSRLRSLLVEGSVEQTRTRCEQTRSNIRTVRVELERARQGAERSRSDHEREATVLLQVPSSLPTARTKRS